MMRRERGRLIGRRRTEVGPEAEEARPHRTNEDRDRRQVSLQAAGRADATPGAHEEAQVEPPTWMHNRLRKWVRQAQHDAGHRPGPDDERAGAVEGVGARGPRAEAGERDPAESVRVFRPGGARPPREVARMVQFIEPICAVLPIAPSTYHRHRHQRTNPTRRSAAGTAQRGVPRRDSAGL